MLACNGRQLAANYMNGSSAVEKRFFDVLFRLSRVGCAGAGVGSGSGLRRNSTKSSPSPSPAAETETHSQKVRQIMRTLPHPTVVLTTTASSTPGVIDWSKPVSNEAPNPTLYRGMTLSSVTSLSMAPQPLITFNIGFPSRTLSALTETRYFLLHVLKANKKGLAIADAFTKGNVVHASSGGENEGESGKKDADGNTQKTSTAFDLAAQTDERLSVRDHTIKGPKKLDIHLPILDSPSVKFVLECKVLGPGDREGGGLIRIGDHVLVVAKVTGIAEVGDYYSLNISRTMEGKTTGNALCYVAGEYAMAWQFTPYQGASRWAKVTNEVEDSTGQVNVSDGAKEDTETEGDNAEDKKVVQKDL